LKFDSFLFSHFYSLPADPSFCLVHVPQIVSYTSRIFKAFMDPMFIIKVWIPDGRWCKTAVCGHWEMPTFEPPPPPPIAKRKPTVPGGNKHVNDSGTWVCDCGIFSRKSVEEYSCTIILVPCNTTCFILLLGFSYCTSC